VVITYPVSIGKMDWKTPIGETRVIQKEKHPNWYPPESVRKEHEANGDPIPAVVKAGPDNPLGDFAMRLAAGNGTYLIHGTNNPMAVGMAITHGCVRMYPEDVAALFPLIPVGTKVWLINEPVKVAFVDGELFLEAHPQVDEEGQNTSTDPDLNLLSEKLDQALGTTTAAIHWDFAKEALQAANGIPTVVGLQADPDPAPSTDPTAAPPAPTPSASTPPIAAPSSSGTIPHAPSTDDATKSAPSAAGTADVTKAGSSAGAADATKSTSSTGTTAHAPSTDDTTNSTSSAGTADVTKPASSSGTADAADTSTKPTATRTADPPAAADTSTKLTATGTVDSPAGADTSTKPTASGSPAVADTSTKPTAAVSAKDAATQPSSTDATNAPSAASASTASDTPTDDPPTTILRPVLRPLPPAGASADAQPDSTSRTASASPEH